jgi:S1-C subfamily serine protease
MRSYLSSTALVLTLGLLLFAEDKPPAEVARFGAAARAASTPEKEALGLGDAIAGRVNGVIAEEPAKDGPAAAIKAGDAILALDGNRLYSNDDLLDFVRTAKPGQKVKVLLKRAESKKEETVEITLGAAPAPKETKIAWQFAGPAQFDAALALAKKEGKKVLVGISGAET